MEYPAQIDCVWLATDESGAVAAMVTAGCGPIPSTVLSGPIEVTRIEEMLLDLPEIGSAAVLKRYGDPSSFIALSNRGLFVYDWTDVHRTTSTEIGLYELVSTPGTAICLDDLPSKMSDSAAALGKGVKIGAATVNVR